MLRARRLQGWITVGGVMGGAPLGGWGGGMERPLAPTAGGGVVTLKGLLVIGGGAMAFAGDVLLLALRDEAPVLLARATAP